jgi:hypothetical protein
MLSACACFIHGTRGALCGVSFPSQPDDPLLLSFSLLVSMMMGGDDKSFSFPNAAFVCFHLHTANDTETAQAENFLVIGLMLKGLGCNCVLVRHFFEVFTVCWRGVVWCEMGVKNLRFFYVLKIYEKKL